MHLYHLWNTLLAAAFIVAGFAVGWVVFGFHNPTEINVPFEVPGPTVERTIERYVPGPERIIIREVERAVHDGSCDVQSPRGKTPPKPPKQRKQKPSIKKAPKARAPKGPRNITPPAPRERWTLDEFEERNRARTYARIFNENHTWQTQ
jgi:hypothetical protein